MTILYVLNSAVTPTEKLNAADTKMGGIDKGIENFKIVIGGKFDWEHLLAPAPLSISVLGDLMILSNVAQDFSLEKGRPADGFKYMKWPKSFRATLVQISNTGYTTFLKAHTNMDQIRLHTMAIPAQMKQATSILFSKNPVVIEKFLELPLERVLASSNSCVTLSQEVVDGFEKLIDLTMEVIAVSTATKGISQVEQEKINRQVAIANFTLVEKEKLKRRIEQEHENMVEFVEKNQKIFEKSLEEVPGTLEVLVTDKGSYSDSPSGQNGNAGNLIEKVGRSSYSAEDIQCLIKTANVPDCISTIRELVKRLDKREDFESLNLAGTGGFNTTTDLKPLKDITWNHQCSPIVNSVTLVDSLVQALQQHLSEISLKRTEDIVKKTNLTNTTLKTKEITSANNTKPDSSKEIATKLLKETNLTNTTLKTKEIPSANNTKPVSSKETAIKLLDELKALIIWMQKKTLEGKEPIQSRSPLSPPIPPVSGFAGNNALITARFKVAQAIEVLRQARESAESTRAQMIQVNNEYIQYMEKAQRLQIEKVSYDEIIKMLSEGLQLLSELKQHWAKLNEFFLIINNLVKVTMNSELNSFVKQLKKNSDVKILTDDVSLQFTANLIFETIMKANQASFFVYSMASLYIKVSNNHIMDSLASLDTMINMDPRKSDIKTARNNLLAKCNKDSDEIIKLVSEEKQKLIESIDTREREIEESYAFLKDITLPKTATEFDKEMDSAFEITSK
ncbi:uncharacterized protein LOC124342610 isoform X2 [Daphnia pulicaria]|uniref:uncharacterized protein LOC124342610 isoform X2 n=1 Tax=Daphnia pulicaria TaxID=35523 RepID=UPI001EEA3542|nr:uncharacterized protein LOC124342610 isoform X2 [Daphnia pulicaria]